MENPGFRTGIIILAAGASTRMGQAKQLLRLHEESLIQRIVNQGLKVGFQPVVVVLGAHQDLIKTELKDQAVLVASNPDWAKGMGGTIVVGLQHLLQHAPDTQAVFILVADQPMVFAETLQRMLELQHQTSAPLVAARYSGTFGVPALFRAELFADLAALTPAQGAKRLIQKYQDQAAFLDFPEGALDLDTPEDWAAFSGKILPPNG